ncbi:MAG: peptidyl-prolyl cis-trans isomerase D [Pseudohongiellaceae bacterium]|jgi:peptidyl-prolyl cis-trans isomerase D
MLQNIRDNSQGIIAKTIVGLIVVIFAAAGVESLLGGGGSNAAAEINGEEVSAGELEQAVRVQKRRLLESMGENADISMLDDGLIQRSALDQLVQKKLLLQAANQQGVTASPVAIDQLIVNMPEFQDNGQFSPQLYENVLRSNGYGMVYFKQLLADDVVARQFSAGIAGSDFVTDQEFDLAAKIIGQKRSFEYITLSIADELAKAEVSDGDIDTYYQAHLEDYQREPKSKLAYIEIKQSDFVKLVEESQIKEAYDLEAANFEASEERKVSHILIEINDTRDQTQALIFAQELKAKIESGETFASVAEASSDDVASAFVGGDLGYTEGDTFPADFEAAVASAELNVVTEPVTTEAGVHLINVTDIQGSEQPSFDDRKLALKQIIEMQRAEVEFVNQVEQLRDLVFNSADLQGPASELSLTVAQSGWVGQSESVGLLAKPSVLKAAFSDEVLKDGNNSEVIELAHDHFVVVRVLEHKPAEAIPLDEVNTQITFIIKKSKASDILLASANEIVTKLRGGDASFEQLSESGAGKVEAEQQVSRITAKAPRDLSAAIFSMARPGKSVATVETHDLRNGDYAVVSLKEVVDGIPSDLSEGEQQAVRAQLYRASSGQSIAAYQQSIKDRADITLY